VDTWSDDRAWEQLATRLGHGQDGWELTSGPVLEKSVLPMHSHVQSPMRHGNLFLAGDAAHIVPPTGAKGLNLAVGDVKRLAQGIEDFYRSASEEGLSSYTEQALKRIWRAEYFSWWMTSMLHTFDDASPFQRQIQRAELENVVNSRALSTALAENYVGAF
jgi:p-hydroxybenzoate 3-monooxygenase